MGHTGTGPIGSSNGPQHIDGLKAYLGDDIFYGDKPGEGVKPDKLSKIKTLSRFNIDAEEQFGYIKWIVINDSGGEWVKWTDIEKIINE